MIIVLGGSGYIGAKLVDALTSRGDNFMTLTRSSCDYYDVPTLSAVLADTDAKFLINAAGFTGRPNVDACEYQKADCLLGNAVLPGRIRQACEATSTPWIHVSSGCIYTGSRMDGQGFTERDTPNFCFRTDNCSFYSGTKALGEEVLSDARDCYVLRLRIPFDNVDSPRNYLSKLIRYERLLDARNSLTDLGEFARACLHCIDDRPTPGIYNATNSGSVSTREVVDLIRVNGVSDKTFQFFESEAEFMQEAAETPRSNCILDNRKAIAAGFPLTEVTESLNRAMREWQGAVGAHDSHD